MNALLEKSKAFAHAAHDSIGQKRKYTGVPYWVHTDEVRALFLSYFPNEIAGAIACDLHDVVEDVFPKNPHYSLDLIRAEFGDIVARIVFDVTDQYTKENYPEWNRAKRDKKEHERQGLVQPVSQSLKLCDITCNTGTIIDEDPNYAPTYLNAKWHAIGFLNNGLSNQLWMDTFYHLGKQFGRLKE